MRPDMPRSGRADHGREDNCGVQGRSAPAKDTHGSKVRQAPPLLIRQPELEQELDAVAAALPDLDRR